ncbi:hypothetical protein GOL34_25255 [Sinorhizobium medicae]|nr:hypothetical protein [Sinorhizobium medicae]
MTEKLTLAQRVVRAVCKLGDTPDPDQPDTLLVKAGDLKAIIDNHLERWLLTVYDPPQTREEGTSTPPAAPVRVPDGWQLVPKEPTQEMLDAVTAADQQEPFSDKTMRGVFVEMLSASPSPADSRDALIERAEAFGQVVAARKAHVDAVAAYNARLELVRAERERGNWQIKMDREYDAMSEAQSAFIRTVQKLADAALAAKEDE